jgi:hypothetical protein
VSIMSNYPAGVSDAVINAHFGETCDEECEAYDDNGDDTGMECRCVERAEELLAEGIAVARASALDLDY